MSARDRELLRPCTECGGDGVLWDLATTAHPEPECGVCLGDGRLLTARGHDVHAIAAAAIDPDCPPAPLRYVDHSGHTHRCVRCSPQQTDHDASSP